MSVSSHQYSLRKSRQILQWVNKLYKRHWKSLTKQQLTDLEASLASLDAALLEKDRREADIVARRLENFAHRYLPTRHWLQLMGEGTFALAVALLIAIFIRQMWFELYQIPTGSMRPTFKEKDHLLVSKTSFGINVPLQPKHLIFDPDLVQRTGVVIFTGENLDLPDTDTTYFWLFNAKKRYVKRMIGKPGDTLYFYGGKIYGIDRDGNDIEELRESPWMANLEHIPFSTFDGRVGSMPDPKDPNIIHLIFQHMNQPIGRLSWWKSGKKEGELLADGQWVAEKPLAAGKPHKRPEAYTDFWGMQNYAIARLLTEEQVDAFTGHDEEEIASGTLYLELLHTPGLTYPHPNIRGNYRVLTPFSSIIPLSQEHLDRLMDSLYTARFVVKDERAVPYQVGGRQPGSDSPRMRGIPDGTYEFYFGRAYEIGFGGTPHELPSDHPLYRKDPEWLQTLFNMGIEISTRVAPSGEEQPFFPSRYAYFRDGDLYVMGAPVLEASDPVLKDFNERELLRKVSATTFRPYIPFVDHGSPMKDGEIDRELIEAFGLKVPEGQYFVLGDNHAMSGDSRYFGFVPEANLRGTPLTLIWPWDGRLGPPPQVDYPFVTLPRAIIWMVALGIAVGYFCYQQWRQQRPTFVKLSA